jgi:hypothetical protein
LCVCVYVCARLQVKHVIFTIKFKFVSLSVNLLIIVINIIRIVCCARQELKIVVAMHVK